MIPKLFDIVKRVEKIEISDRWEVITHDDALKLYEKHQVVHMDHDVVSSSDSFLQFVKLHA